MGTAGRILVVCTGNVCRSPYIERLLAAGLRDLGVDVTSAGTHALVGQAMEPGSARLLDDDGISPHGFIARQLTAPMLRDADLVLAVTREHRRESVQLEPKALRYAYVVNDFCDLLSAAELHRRSSLEPPDASVVTRLAFRAETSRGAVRPRLPGAVGIVDPYRQSADVFAAMAQQVCAAVPTIVRAAHEVAAGM